MFADTGGEKPETYAYQAILADYLARHGLPPVMRVWKKNADMTPAPTLEQACLANKQLPSIAYGFKSCSDHYKIRPQEQVLRNWEPAIQAWANGHKVIKLIGFDAGEEYRVDRVTESTRYENRYPLIEYGWDREACVSAIHRAGLPLPPKSSCFFCPSTTKKEILGLQRTHPDLMHRAIQIERNADLTTLNGLGRRFSWESLLEQGQFDFPDPPAVPCMCYDGEVQP
jgi:hypothetical protein